jgi:hypothetical protein
MMLAPQGPLSKAENLPQPGRLAPRPGQPRRGASPIRAAVQLRGRRAGRGRWAPPLPGPRPAPAHRIGSAYTGTRSTFWKPLWTRNGFAGPVTGQLTGWCWGELRGGARTIRRTVKTDRSKRCWDIRSPRAFASRCRGGSMKSPSRGPDPPGVPPLDISIEELQGSLEQAKP